MFKISNLLFEQIDDVSTFEQILANDVENIGSVILERGVVDAIDTFKLFQTHEKRNPRNTNTEVNQMIENMRENDYKGIFPSRIYNALFATTQSGTAESYGKKHYCFVVKPYFASYSMDDATISYFNEMSDYLIYAGKRITSLINIDPKYKDEIYEIRNLCANASQIQSVEELKITIGQIDDIINDPDIDTFLEDVLVEVSETIQDIINLIVEYFEESLFENAKAPWESDAIEYTITCKEFYLVDIVWFQKNFKYSTFRKRYVRK